MNISFKHLSLSIVITALCIGFSTQCMYVKNLSKFSLFALKHNDKKMITRMMCSINQNKKENIMSYKVGKKTKTKGYPVLERENGKWKVIAHSHTAVEAELMSSQLTQNAELVENNKKQNDKEQSGLRLYPMPKETIIKMFTGTEVEPFDSEIIEATKIKMTPEIADEWMKSLKISQEGYERSIRDGGGVY